MIEGIFFLACILAAVVIYHHYQTYPGLLDRSTLRVAEKGLDYLDLSWTNARNTKNYKVFYKIAEEDNNKMEIPVIDDSWTELETPSTNIRIPDLEEGVRYSVSIRPDSEEKPGIPSKIKDFTTKKTQSIEIDDQIMKLTSSKPFKLKADAETNLSFESSDTEVAEVDETTGNIVIKAAGTTDITVKAMETENFTGAVETVEVSVLDAQPVPASGARPTSIYYASADNCDVVMSVSGAGGADVPQGMAYTGERYMVCFGMYGPTRIVSYDLNGEDRDVENPDVSLGHPNGFTYNTKNGWCYCVRGNSNKCVIYDTKEDSYSTISMPVGCSGIGYDKERNLLYTSARGSLVSYNPDDYSIENRFRRVNRSGTEFMQDCEACDGLLLNCVSGGNKQGTNYIDIYDMENAQYIGTVTCDLGEVESAIINNEGYLEILSNSTTDYIWRTDFNIKMLAAAVKDYNEQEKEPES